MRATCRRVGISSQAWQSHRHALESRNLDALPPNLLHQRLADLGTYRLLVVSNHGRSKLGVVAIRKLSGLVSQLINPVHRLVTHEHVMYMARPFPSTAGRANVDLMIQCTWTDDRRCEAMIPPRQMFHHQRALRRGKRPRAAVGGIDPDWENLGVETLSDYVAGEQRRSNAPTFPKTVG